MTVVIPIAYSDLAHLPFFTAVLAHFGPYPEDSALILPTPEMAMTPEVSRHIQTICDCFGGRKGDVESGRAVVQVLQNDLQRGWPIGGNLHFENGVWFMNEFFPTQAWLWMETDCYGITPYWLTTLKQAYHMASTPYMGWTEDSYQIEMRGGKRTRVLMEGKHMAGPGFYPAGYTKIRGPGGAPNTMWKIQDKVFPFTIGARWEHRPVNHTAFICHKPRTVNWHIGDDGQVRCMDTPDKDPLDIAREGAVDLKGVVFVHGPKDGSLAQMILSGEIDQYTGNRIPVTRRAPVPQSVTWDQPGPKEQASTVPPAASAPPSTFSSIMPETPEAMALQWLSQTKAEWLEKSGHTDPEIFEDQLISALEVARRHLLPVQVGEKPQSQSTSQTAGPSETVKVVMATLAAGNVQIGALAKQMGRDKKELKDELTKAGFTFNGTPGWVKAPAQAA